MKAIGRPTLAAYLNVFPHVLFTRIDDIPSNDHGTAFLCLCVGIVSCKLQPASEEGRPGGCTSGVDVVVGQPDGRCCQGVNVGSHKRAGRIREPNVCITLVVGQAANKMNLEGLRIFWSCYVFEAHMNMIFGGLAKTQGRRTKNNRGFI